MANVAPFDIHGRVFHYLSIHVFVRLKLFFCKFQILNVLSMATPNAVLKTTLGAHATKDRKTWTVKEKSKAGLQNRILIPDCSTKIRKTSTEIEKLQRQQLNALDMAVSKMVIEEDISKRVAKFENGGCDPDHKTQPSQSFKDAMKTELMMGLQKVTMNMARPDCAASIQKIWRKKCASQLQRREKWLLGSSFDVNSDESWKLKTKCPKASSSSKDVIYVSLQMVRVRCSEQ